MAELLRGHRTGKIRRAGDEAIGGIFAPLGARCLDTSSILIGKEWGALGAPFSMPGSHEDVAS